MSIVIAVSLKRIPTKTEITHLLFVSEVSDNSTDILIRLTNARCRFPLIVFVSLPLAVMYSLSSHSHCVLLLNDRRDGSGRRVLVLLVVVVVGGRAQLGQGLLDAQRGQAGRGVGVPAFLHHLAQRSQVLDENKMLEILSGRTKRIYCLTSDASHRFEHVGLMPLSHTTLLISSSEGSGSTTS